MSHIEAEILSNMEQHPQIPFCINFRIYTFSLISYSSVI